MASRAGSGAAGAAKAASPASGSGKPRAMPRPAGSSAAMLGELQAENTELLQTVTTLTEKLADLTLLLSDVDEAVCPYYVVEFGTAAIGMILTINEKWQVEVVELRSDSSGRPLGALASGKIKVGDIVLAVNDANLMRHRSLEAVADEFRRARRPAQVLFQKGATLSDY